MQGRLDGKLALLYTLLVLQILIVVIYVASAPPLEIISPTTQSSVTFVKLGIPKVINSQELIKTIHTKERKNY